MEQRQREAFFNATYLLQYVVGSTDAQTFSSSGGVSAYYSTSSHVLRNVVPDWEAMKQ